MCLRSVPVRSRDWAFQTIENYCKRQRHYIFAGSRTWVPSLFLKGIISQAPKYATETYILYRNCLPSRRLVQECIDSLDPVVLYSVKRKTKYYPAFFLLFELLKHHHTGGTHRKLSPFANSIFHPLLPSHHLVGQTFPMQG